MTLAELQEMASRQQQQIEAQQQMLANKVSLESDCLARNKGRKSHVKWREDWGIRMFFTHSKQRAPFFGCLSLNLKVNVCNYPVVKHINNASDGSDHLAY